MEFMWSLNMRGYLRDDDQKTEGHREECTFPGRKELVRSSEGWILVASNITVLPAGPRQARVVTRDLLQCLS